MAATVQQEASDGVEKVIQAHQWLQAIAKAIKETTEAFQAAADRPAVP